MGEASEPRPESSDGAFGTNALCPAASKTQQGSWYLGKSPACYHQSRHSQGVGVAKGPPLREQTGNGSLLGTQVSALTTTNTRSNLRL